MLAALSASAGARPLTVWGVMDDLEHSIARGSEERRVASLRQVTDLFLRDAEALNDEQIDLFDMVIARLVAAIETRARAELAERLADAPKAPPGVIRTLAHDEIVVARPILSRFQKISNDDLVAGRWRRAVTTCSRSRNASR